MLVPAQVPLAVRSARTLAIPSALKPFWIVNGTGIRPPSALRPSDTLRRPSLRLGAQESSKGSRRSEFKDVVVNSDRFLQPTVRDELVQHLDLLPLRLMHGRLR